jgi:M6 family metalloprotease-like protein
MTDWLSRFTHRLALFTLGFLGLALSSGPAAAAGGKDACKTERGLVILVEFPGTPHEVDRAVVEDRFFGKLNQYVQQMSYGRVCIGGEVTPRWYRMPHPISHYSISSRNLEVDRSRLKRLIDDALAAVDADFDVATYDFVALMLGAKQPEYGMIGLCGYPGMLGWQAKDQLRSKSGKPVRGVAIFSYQAHVGTLFHDVTHVIGGVMPDGKRAVPCLYDHDLQARPGPQREIFVDAIINMGFWDPMSCHFYKRDEPPPGISSWTKLRLGWLPDDKVAVVRPGETREVLLGPLEDGQSATLAIRIPLSATTYYLVENRQPIGADRILPGSGVLIMRADDSIAECRHGRAPVKLVDADPSVPHLEGAAFDLGKRDRFTDKAAGIAIELLEKVGQSYRIRVGAQP